METGKINWKNILWGRFCLKKNWKFQLKYEKFHSTVVFLQFRICIPHPLLNNGVTVISFWDISSVDKEFVARVVRVN